MVVTDGNDESWAKDFRVEGPLHRKEPMTPMCNVISRHEHPWEEGWWEKMVILCSIAWKVLKPQHFSFTHGFYLRFPPQAVLHEVYPLGNSFVKAVKSESALAKVCPGSWAGSSARTSEIFEWCRLKWTVLPRYQILKNYCPVKSCFCWKFHKFKWLDHPTSTISKTRLQLWNRKRSHSFGFARR